MSRRERGAAASALAAPGAGVPHDRSRPPVAKSFLAAEAIRECVAHNEWQVAEIRKALKEADAGDFASEKDVAALARKWK